MSDDPARVVKIIRSHVHDVRNHINSLDLETMLLGELISDPEALGSLARMRSQLAQLEATMKGLVYRFAEPQPIEVTADALLQLWKRQVAPLEDPAHAVKWSVPAAATAVNLDAQAIAAVMRELLVAAWNRHPGTPLSAGVTATPEAVQLEIREPVPRVEPSAETTREHRRLAEVNGGRFSEEIDATTHERVTRLEFPAVAA